MSKPAISARAPILAIAIRRPLAAVAVGSAVVLAILGLTYTGRSGPEPLDSWRPPLLLGATSPAASAARFLAFCGEPAGAVLVTSLLIATCFLLRRPGTAALAVAGPGLTVGLATTLKYAVQRTIHGGDLSFPSGHTAFATAVALVLAFLVAEQCPLGPLAAMLLVLVIAAVPAAAMAWAVTSLGMHYPTDTLGGFFAALSVVPAAAFLIDELRVRCLRR